MALRPSRRSSPRISTPPSTSSVARVLARRTPVGRRGRIRTCACPRTQLTRRTSRCRWSGSWAAQHRHEVVHLDDAVVGEEPGDQDGGVGEVELVGGVDLAHRPGEPPARRRVSGSSRAANTLGRVEARGAEPVDGAVGADQGARAQVTDQTVVGDRQRTVGPVRHRSPRATEPPAVRAGEVESGLRTPGALLVGLRRGGRAEHRLADLPQPVDLVGLRVNSVWSPRSTSSSRRSYASSGSSTGQVVGEVEPQGRLGQLHVGPGPLCPQVDADPGGVGQLEHQLVGPAVDVGEQARRRCPEPQRDGATGRAPSPCPCAGRTGRPASGRCRRTPPGPRSVSVARVVVDVVLVAVAVVLAEDHALRVERPHRLEDRRLRVAQRASRRRRPGSSRATSPSSWHRCVEIMSRKQPVAS